MEAESDNQLEDESILRVARELCHRFNLDKISPDRLSWQEQYSRSRFSKDNYGNPIGRYVTPHYPLFDQGSLILRPVLRGSLSIEDWRPLLTSSAIYYGELRSKANRRAAFRWFPAVVLLAIFIGEAFIRDPRLSEPLPFFALVASIVASAIVAFYSSLLVSRKLMLVADRKAAELTGSQRFLEVLKEIQSIKHLDAEQNRMSAWAWTEYGDAPSMEKRIENLQNT